MEYRDKQAASWTPASIAPLAIASLPSMKSFSPGASELIVNPFNTGLLS